MGSRSFQSASAKQSRCASSEIPASRWSVDDYYDPDRNAPGKTVCRRMGVLDDVDVSEGVSGRHGHHKLGRRSAVKHLRHHVHVVRMHVAAERPRFDEI